MKKFLKSLIDFKLLAISFLTGVGFALFSFTAINIDFLDPVELALADIDFTDLTYSILRDDEAISIDTNLVIVNIGSISRLRIADMINKINEYKPKVIGIDAIFEKKTEDYDDSVLTDALSSVKNLVIVESLEDYSEDSSTFMITRRSLEKLNQNARIGFANIPEANSFRTIRTFNPVLTLRGAMRESFASQVVKIADPESYNILCERDNEVEHINFHGNYNKFFLFDYEDSENDEVDFSFISDKIVLIGYLGESFGGMDYSIQDKFFTPLNPNYAGRTYPDMFGILIHANIISMILNKTYIDEVPFLLSGIILILLIYINALLFKGVYKYFKNYYGLSSKALIIVESVFILLFLLFIFNYFFIKFEIKLLLISIVFLPDILEIYFKKQIS